MCGISGGVGPSAPKQGLLEAQLKSIEHRGPDDKGTYFGDGIGLGMCRLAIIEIAAGKQPASDSTEKIHIVWNGEIYNYKKLYNQMDSSPITDSDCEVIIHLYIKYGIEQTLIMLDGVYSFVMYDIVQNKFFVARDPLGVRPLYKLYNKHNNLYGFASELKCLEFFYNLNNNDYFIEQFEPGTYSAFQNNINKWEQIISNKIYFIPTFSYTMYAYKSNEIKKMLLSNISNYLNGAIIKRCNTTERPIACLLSGGLDSSLIAALVSNYFKGSSSRQIETYSIGLKGSEDIKYAKIVADYIGSKHTEIIVTEKEMFNAIPEVIKAIESYDTTTVRASIGNYLIGKYIASNSEAKVIFNGDGSDELFGGYLYMHKCLDDIDFDKETRRLLKDIHLFDVLRSDKSISSNGLEPRTPFLDKTFVNYVLSIPIHFRNHNNFGRPEKYLLRESFDKNNFVSYDRKKILPDEILWRKKEAFSDGVSSKGRSLFEILQEFIAIDYNKTTGLETYKPCIELEKEYYKNLFEKEFPNCQHILPYFWMPKYTNATDPSARTLEFYNKPK
jgi:asparagine synthase (glutamine-hydrolysing)